MTFARVAALSLLLALTPALARHLTPDQYAECKRDRDEVVAQNQALTVERDRMDAAGAAIEAGEVPLRAMLAQNDADRARLQALRDEDQKATTVADHLRIREEFKAIEKPFNERLARYNDGVRAQEAKRGPHNVAATNLNQRLAQLDQRARAVDARCVEPTAAP